MIVREQMLPMLRSLTLAIGVHGLMALLVVLGTINWEPFRKPKPVGLTIEAVIIDTSEIKERREQARREANEAVQRKEAAERRDREMEQQRQREIEQQKQREADQEALRKQQAQDRLSQLRIERERKKEEERQKQEKALEQIREQAKEAERLRQIDEQQLKQLEQRKQEEADKQRQQLEAIERQKQLDAEARQFKAGRQAGKADEYEAAVQSVVTQNWLRPPTAQPGLRCTLKIVQIPGGQVISAAIAGPCNGDEATRRSVVAAVERVGALPYRGFEDVFQREIEFNFIYDGD